VAARWRAPVKPKERKTIDRRNSARRQRWHFAALSTLPCSFFHYLRCNLLRRVISSPGVAIAALCPIRRPQIRGSAVIMPGFSGVEPPSDHEFDFLNNSVGPGPGSCPMRGVTGGWLRRCSGRAGKARQPRRAAQRWDHRSRGRWFPVSYSGRAGRQLLGYCSHLTKFTLPPLTHRSQSVSWRQIFRTLRR
jgi:hypothetical protein